LATTDIISYKILDFAGDEKSLPYYVPSGGTIAGAQALADVTAPLLDDGLDGQIVQITLTITLDLPVGLKSSPVAGNTVHEGALVNFLVDGSDYSFSFYAPSWENAGFTGNTVLNTGDYAAIISDMNQFVNENGDALLSYRRGRRAFRK